MSEVSTPAPTVAPDLSAAWLDIQRQQLELQRQQMEFQRQQMQAQVEQTKAMQETAESVKKQRPENITAPDISAFNPMGERDHPRPEMPCATVWFGGFRVEREQCSVEELTLLRQLQPGNYRCTRIDELVELVPVEFLQDGTGKVGRINIRINTGKEHKHAWPSMKRVLQEIISQQPAAQAA